MVSNVAFECMSGSDSYTGTDIDPFLVLFQTIAYQELGVNLTHKPQNSWMDFDCSPI